jgi:hypothetical protein
MNGNVTADGITRDLEAMKRVGIGGFQIFDVGTGIPKGPAECLSADGLKLMQHAAAEADRPRLDFEMHNCPGWSASGGPWITPSSRCSCSCGARRPCAAAGRSTRPCRGPGPASITTVTLSCSRFPRSRAARPGPEGARGRPDRQLRRRHAELEQGVPAGVPETDTEPYDHGPFEEMQAGSRCSSGRTAAAVSNATTAGAPRCASRGIGTPIEIEGSWRVTFPPQLGALLEAGLLGPVRWRSALRRPI